MQAQRFPKDLPGLTSMRFCAALWVVLFHFVWWLTPVGAPRLDVPFIAEGDLAVDFFFILSGFILTHAHYEQVTSATLRAGSFLIKRLARIYPMHLATLLFYVIFIVALRVAHLSLTNPERYTATQFLLNIFLIHGWQFQDAGAWNFASWSISAEWFAYLLFPALAGLIINRLRDVKNGLLLAIALCLLVAAYAMSPTFFGTDFFSLHSNFGWFRVFPEFVYGIVLYRICAHAKLGWAGTPLALALTVAAIVATAIAKIDLLVVFLLSFLIVVVAEIARSGGPRFIRSSILVYLGTISYDLYMVHIPVATIMLKGSSTLLGHTPLWIIPVAVFISIAVAAGAHHLIEVPANKMIVRRFVRGSGRNLSLEQAAV